MNFDTRGFSELTRKATDLMADTADVPIVLHSRLGEHHELTRTSREMVANIEALVRELRSFDASDARDAGETDFVVS